MLSLCFLEFSVGLRAFVIGLSPISSIFSYNMVEGFKAKFLIDRRQMWAKVLLHYIEATRGPKHFFNFIHLSRSLFVFHFFANVSAGEP